MKEAWKANVYGLQMSGNQRHHHRGGTGETDSHSRYGASVWIHILIRKYRLQINVHWEFRKLVYRGRFKPHLHRAYVLSTSRPPGSALTVTGVPARAR